MSPLWGCLCQPTSTAALTNNSLRFECWQAKPVGSPVIRMCLLCRGSWSKGAKMSIACSACTCTHRSGATSSSPF